MMPKSKMLSHYALKPRQFQRKLLALEPEKTSRAISVSTVNTKVIQQIPTTPSAVELPLQKQTVGPTN